MFSVIHMDASGNDDPPLEGLSDLYDELASSGVVDGNVAVIHQDSGWCVSAHRDGRLVFEHLQSGGERHMLPVGKARTIALWCRLIAGDTDGVLTEPWQTGYVTPS